MFDLPAPMLSVLSIFLPLFFSQPSYINFLELFQGHILCKTHTTFSDVLAYVRANILKKKYIFWFDKNNEIQDPAIKEMIELLTAA